MFEQQVGQTLPSRSKLEAVDLGPREVMELNQIQLVFERLSRVKTFLRGTFWR